MSRHSVFYSLLLSLSLLLLFQTEAFAHGAGYTGLPGLQTVDTRDHANFRSVRSGISAAALYAPCGGGPVIDGITLDECYVHAFNVNGDDKTITVWYTKNPVEATREVDGSDVTLQHWINSDAEAVQVAQWFQEAWIRFHTDSGHHLYDSGCGDNVNVQMEDGVGWSGIAYWASSGNCNIGIDSPMVRGGGGQRTVYHEAQHYVQFSYDNGCYANLKANYNDGKAAGNAEFTEGYADLGSDSVNAMIDAGYEMGSSYNPMTSMYDKNYHNRFVKYLSEQLGTVGNLTDPWYHIDAMYAHYEMCDAQDDLYVLDDLIPSLSGGKWNKKEFFLNFFAANWALKWADATTQPELIYRDAPSSAYNLPGLTQDTTMNGGTQNWSDTTPDDYAASYYQVRPQSGCDYVQVEVEGEAGAKLGINLMAADTSGTPSVLRSAHIGQSYVRTFAGAGIHDRVVAVVNSFDDNHDYDVTMTCVSPSIDIKEPRQSNFALVGEPASPISYLARVKVTSSGTPVRGLAESSFTFDAEGDAISIIPGTMQEVSEEYWFVLNPPVKPDGTTFVDFEACLDTGVCDSETDALLYVAPGNSDVALVFDGSGSMDTEDVTGEGTRLLNAQKAGDVVADLLRDGDRIMVTDFSAKDNPAGCGNNDHNCELDLRLLQPRTDVSGQATINATHSAIDLVSARDWTPIGAGLQDAKNKLLAAPFSLNPKHIFLLSDGEQNVNPFYNDVRDELVESGVIINTIAYGPEAPDALMAQIAADTGGEFRPVPTTNTGTVAAAGINGVNGFQSLQAANAPAEMVATLAGPALPGQLGLANVYDYFETEAQDATRVFHLNYTDVTFGEWKTVPAIVDESASTLRFVVAGKQSDSTGCAGSHRFVEVSPANSTNPNPPATHVPKEIWYPISPVSTNMPIPANWEVRNSLFDDVLIVTNPQPGLWKFRTRYDYLICASAAAADAQAAPAEVSGGFSADFMMNMSLQSTIQLEGRILNLTNNHATAGDVLPMIATLMTKDGPLPGAIVAASIQKPTGSPEATLLLDDGQHNDGQAGDGIYGWNYSKTTVGGGYEVRIVAAFKDPLNENNTLFREWNGGFWIDGPEPGREGWDGDKDNDDMGDAWEIRCGLDPTVNDYKLDKDKDGIPNGREWQLGTLPCDPDTDDGGENDGSEVANQRNPLWAADDNVRPLGTVNVRPLNETLVIDWRKPVSYTQIIIFVSTNLDEMGEETTVDSTGHITIENLTNDIPYYVRLVGYNGNAATKPTEPIKVTPKADPDPPAGAMLIENGARVATSKNVTLNLSATDVPLNGMAQGANGHMTDQLSAQFNDVSGNIEMRIANSGDMSGAVWEPFAQTKAWTLSCEDGEFCVVYAQFRDGAGNESFIISDDILLEIDESQDPDGQQPPLPTIDETTPGSAMEGSSGMMISVKGNGFQNGATVYWNGAARTTTYISEQELQVELTNEDMATAGAFAITVANPGQEGTPSNPVNFMVEEDPSSGGDNPDNNGSGSTVKPEVYLPMTLQ